MSIVIDKYEELDDQQNLRRFSFVFAISQFVGALAVILVAIWMGNYGEGFGWKEPDQKFRYHPLFMVIGIIFLYGEAILVYRLFRHEKKKVTKLGHIALHTMVFLFFVLALKAVFDSHNLASTPKPNMYSLHSWIGLSTVLLFCFQYAAGFLTFFLPGLAISTRQWYMPIHQFFGVLIFVMATSTALMGMAEKAAFSTFKTEACEKDKFCSENVVVNFLGVCVLLYSLSVVYLVVNPRFKRRPLPEEEEVLHRRFVND